MASRKPAAGALSNYLLQIDLIGSENPSISRTLSVPPSTTLNTLHSAIQVAFGWGNVHPHRFGIFYKRGTHYRTSTVCTLSQVFENAAALKEKRIEYLYDFHDNWVHHITLIGRANILTSTITCLSGEGGPAAEDCGGCTGWEKIKKAYREHHCHGCPCPDRKAHNKMRWHEKYCTNGRRGGAGSERVG